MKKEYDKYNIKYKLLYNGDTSLSYLNKTINLNEINSSKSKLIANNKIDTNKILNDNNISVCKYFIWDITKSFKQNLYNMNNLLQFPVVIKYARGEQGT